MLDLNNYKYIIFDCDGTILESNQIKTDGFKYALNNEKALYKKKFLEFHNNNFSVNRYKKFEYFYKHIKKQKKYESELENTLKRYKNYTIKNIKKSSFINGFEFFIKSLSLKKIPLFLVSATSEEDLIKIMKYKKIDNYFSKILGSPNSKESNIKYIITKMGNTKGLSFGDSKSDFEISKRLKLKHVHVNSKSIWKVVSKKTKIKIIEDYADIKF